MQNQHLDIRNVIDSGRTKQVEENREKLFLIVETIKFCGRQELALRGTNDSGHVSVTDEEPVTNDGNFRTILKMRIKRGDTKLLKHCKNIALNATYMSGRVQNDLISICGEIIQKEIVKCFNEAKVFSVLINETSDISGHKQLLLCVRYTKKVKTCYVVKEDFLGFVKVDNTTAQLLAATIIASLKNLDIDCNNMVGQGYDGAAVKKGALNGVQAIIRKSFPRALFVHCSSHSLNLALCHLYNVPSIRNCIETVKAIGNFLRASPKRTSFLQARIRANFSDATWQKLTPMSKTRWVENHNALLKFIQIFKSIIEALEQFSTDLDMETSTKAFSFLKSALASKFVVSLCFLSKVFAATLTVCKVLQSPLCDLITAVDHIENVISHFQDIRSNIEKEFLNSFAEVKGLLADVNEEIKLPRLTSVQKHRANPNTSNPEQYYRLTVAISLLENLTSQFKIRFTDHKKVIAAMYILIPTVCSENKTPFPRENLVIYEDLSIRTLRCVTCCPDKGRNMYLACDINPCNIVCNVYITIFMYCLRLLQLLL
ncbi:hypothetical protein RN001_013992 [Aquatica leii]|uniref:DUF4371 domain-containing protein n=1 Tax=Aquatica leii TaxID=1421715 RepID=A0AAN7P0U1_9COLE|nr:hypothetical protein RN001_013992 [Aquatica leii]